MSETARSAPRSGVAMGWEKGASPAAGGMTGGASHLVRDGDPRQAATDCVGVALGSPRTLRRKQPSRPSESDRSGGLFAFVSPIIPAGMARRAVGIGRQRRDTVGCVGEVDQRASPKGRCELLCSKDGHRERRSPALEGRKTRRLRRFGGHTFQRVAGFWRAAQEKGWAGSPTSGVARLESEFARLTHCYQWAMRTICVQLPEPAQRWVPGGGEDRCILLPGPRVALSEARFAPVSRHSPTPTDPYGVGDAPKT